jgi:hypothetical protein
VRVPWRYARVLQDDMVLDAASDENGAPVEHETTPEKVRFLRMDHDEDRRGARRVLLGR